MRGLAQPMSATMLENLVFWKPYFDRDGLIVALDDDRAVGFVHAGFGPNEEKDSYSTELGVTCLLMTHPHPEREAIAAELLHRSEQYLRKRGGRVLYGGGIRPLDPYYLGLYGGSELPGILASDSVGQELFRGGGYREIDRCIVLQRQLAGFRPTVDRCQMQVRRRYNVEAVFDPPAANWWEACTVGQTERTRFELVPRKGGPVAGQATVWNMEPLSSCWGVHAMGVSELQVDESARRQGLATFLMGETLRQIHTHGVTLVEVQAMQHNTAAIGLYQKLGFQQIDQGVVFRKETA
jgi:ribosomal protein S18 acetylase RimI-like enzyme